MPCVSLPHPQNLIFNILWFIKSYWVPPVKSPDWEARLSMIQSLPASLRACVLHTAGTLTSFPFGCANLAIFSFHIFLYASFRLLPSSPSRTRPSSCSSSFMDHFQISLVQAMPSSLWSLAHWVYPSGGARILFSHELCLPHVLHLCTMLGSPLGKKCHTASNSLNFLQCLIQGFAPRRYSSDNFEWLGSISNSEILGLPWWSSG